MWQLQSVQHLFLGDESPLSFQPYSAGTFTLHKTSSPDGIGDQAANTSLGRAMSRDYFGQTGKSYGIR